MHVCWPERCGTGWQNEKMTKGMKPIIPFNYIWGRLIEIPMQVFSVWVPEDALQIRPGSELHLDQW